MTGRRTEKVAETVAREILRDIKRQNLQAGAMLPHEGVMLGRYDIGRGSLREALRILEINGLVTIKTGPNGGPVVAKHDPGNFGQMTTLHLQSIGATYRELLDARVEYEALLARKAAERKDDDATTAIREAMERAKKVSGDDLEYAASSTAFHALVCDSGTESSNRPRSKVDPEHLVATRHQGSLWGWRPAGSASTARGDHSGH